MRRSLSEFCVDVSIKEVLIKHKVNIALLLTLKPAAFNDDVLNMLRIRNRGEELLTSEKSDFGNTGYLLKFMTNPKWKMCAK